VQISDTAVLSIVLSCVNKVSIQSSNPETILQVTQQYVQRSVEDAMLPTALITRNTGCVFLPGRWYVREKYGVRLWGSGYSCIVVEREGDTVAKTYTYPTVNAFVSGFDQLAAYC
jgi:hypothetical protein